MGQKHERLVAKSDQQFMMNPQEHNRSWKVWMCCVYVVKRVMIRDVVLYICLFLYAVECCRMLSLLMVFQCRYRDCDGNL